MRAKTPTPTRKTGEQLIHQQVKELNEYLKTVDLTIVYESVGTQITQKNSKQITKI